MRHTQGLFFIFLLSLLLSLIPRSFSNAEYRVFVLQISDAEETDIQLIKSTLDPHQYADVYPLKIGQTIRYVDTWRCWGRQEPFQPLCEKPANRTPAAVTTELKTSSP